MPDAITEYVEQVCDKKIKDSQCVMAVPASVKKVLSNGMCLVRLIANDTELVIPNWSGCDVVIGDEVRVFFTGSIISERTAYIGAATYVVNRQWSCVSGNFIIDDGSQSDIRPKGERSIIHGTTNISKYGFRSTHKQTVLVTFNGVVVGGNAETGLSQVDIYVDGNNYDFSYKASVFVRGRFYCQNFTLPFLIDEGNHTIEVKISGTGDNIGVYIDANSYVVGQGLTEVEVNDG